MKKWLAVAAGWMLVAAAQAAPPARVVTLGGTVTEIVYGLGQGERLVGDDQSSLYPEAATRLPRVGYYRAGDRQARAHHHRQQYPRQADVDQHIAPQRLFRRGRAPQQRRQFTQRDRHRAAGAGRQHRQHQRRGQQRQCQRRPSAPWHAPPPA